MKAAIDPLYGIAVLIVSAVLAGCSKAPPPSAPAAAIPSSLTPRTPSAQAHARGQPGASTATPPPAAGPEAKPPGAAVRADAQSASLEKEALMVALLPDWKPAKGSRAGASAMSHDSLEAAPNPDSSEHQRVNAADHIHVELNTGDADLYPEPWGVVRLDELHAVLITEADGGWEPAGGTDKIVGAYFFTNHEGAWHLSKSEDVVNKEYSNGLTQLKTQQWPGHGVVLSLTTESGNQGSFSQQVDMTLLRTDSATSLLEASLSESDGSVFQDEKGAFKDGVVCGALESDNFDLPPGDTLEPPGECHDAEGHWSLDGDLIHFTYEGVRRKVNEDGSVAPLQRWKSTVTYRWENGSVKLVEGKDPEFGY